MGARVKTFDASGIAPAGRLFAGDLNSIQDAKADSVDFGQTIDLGTVRIGDSSIQLLKFGTAEARISAALRTDGILRGLGGMLAGAFTTTQRNAIGVGLAPYGIVILNTTTNQYEWNKGTDGARNWQTLGITTVTTADIAADAVTAAKIGAGEVGNSELAALSVDAGKLATDAVTQTKILNGAVSAAKLDAAIAWMATPVTGTFFNGTKLQGSTYTITAPAAGTYILEWGGPGMVNAGQGQGANITNNVTGGTSQFSDVGGSGGTALRTGVVLTNGQVITFTIGGSNGSCGVVDPWAKLIRTA